MHRWTSLAAVTALALLAACGGQVGAVADARSLTTSASLQPGDVCLYGGQQILTGVDVNGDGVLSGNEVQQVSNVCADQPSTACTVRDGDVIITSAADWKGLADAGCTRLTGTLQIATTDVAAFDQPSPLVQVGGIKISSNAALVSLRLPMLTTVDGDVSAEYSPLLAELDLPSLTSVGGHLWVYEVPAFTRLNLPLLQTLGGWIMVNMTSLTAFHLPRLETAAGVAAGYNPALLEVALPALMATGGLEFSFDPVLATLHTPVLGTVAAHVWIIDAPALSGLSLPALTSVPELKVDRAPALATLELPSLATVGTLQLWSVDLLAELDLPELTSADEIWVTFRTGTADANGFRPIRTALTDLSAPKLASVTGKFQISAPVKLERVDLSALATVGGNFTLLGTEPGGWVNADYPGSDPIFSEQSVLTALSLPSLRTVGGELWINGQAALTALDLPLLAEVASFKFTKNGPLAVLSLPELTSDRVRSNGTPYVSTVSVDVTSNRALTAVHLPKVVQASLVVVGNPALTALDLPLLSGGISATISKNDVLASVSFPGASAIGNLTVTLSPALTALSFPAAQSGARFLVQDNPLLAALDLGQLNLATDFVLKGNAALTSLSLPALAMVSGGRLLIDANAALASVSLPRLATVRYSYYGLTIANLPALTTLDLSALTMDDGPFGIYNNPLFPNCQAMAIYDQLAFPKVPSNNVGNNDMTAVCAP